MSEIKYNNDGTYNIAAMNADQKLNYYDAVTTVRQSHRYGHSASRHIIEEYIAPSDIIDGYRD